MPNTYSDLPALFTGIATSLKDRKYDSNTIIADDFPAEIAALVPGIRFRSVGYGSAMAKSFSTTTAKNITANVNAVSNAADRLFVLLLVGHKLFTQGSGAPRDEIQVCAVGLWDGTSIQSLTLAGSGGSFDVITPTGGSTVRSFKGTVSFPAAASTATADKFQGNAYMVVCEIGL